MFTSQNVKNANFLSAKNSFKKHVLPLRIEKLVFIVSYRINFCEQYSTQLEQYSVD